MQYAVTFYGLHEVVTDAICDIIVTRVVAHKIVVKYHRLNRYRQIRLKFVGYGIFDNFVRDNVQPEAVSDAISTV